VKRLLITGASGYLGRYLAGVAQTNASGWEVTGTYFSPPAPNLPVPARPVDLRHAAAVHALLADLQPDAVIHTACSNRDNASVTAIVPAAHNLATACQASGARLVHVSTDLIFDGEHPPYTDDSPAQPLSPYGLAKAEAEAVVRRLCPSAAIGRPSLIWALHPLDRQTGWLVDGLRSGAPVTLFTDEVRCPVYLADLAAALLELAALPQVSGPLNLAGRQSLSRWSFGLRLLDALHLERPPNVRAGTIAESGLVRARNLTLECRRAQAILTTPLRGVDQVLATDLSRAVQAGRPIS